ncbi:MAG: hypothetical protein ACE5I7_13945 [Candidatus Binatia bacterium]
MQATYDKIGWVSSDAEEFAPEETRDMPFFGFVAGILLSLALWSIIAWTVWAVVD